MANDPWIEDHCFVPMAALESETDPDVAFADKCAYGSCGKPELEHWWTVEAYSSNKDAVSGRP